MPLFKKNKYKNTSQKQNENNSPWSEGKQNINKEYEDADEPLINEEGQLAIDVYETQKKIIIKSTIAGVKPENLDISLNNDMLTIRGKREMNKKVKEENYLYQECYWGSFSRSIIMPVEVDSKNIDATLENGILTIALQKIKHEQNIPIKVK